MSNADVIKRLTDAKVIAIIRGVAPDRMIPLAKALLDGGVSCMEITFNQAGADTISSLEALSEAFRGDICLGAGTVLTPGQVKSAVGAGALYIISPNTDAAVIRTANEAGAVSMPGALTPSEIAAAYQAGADIVKVFPAGELGVNYIKAIRAPLAHIPISAVGGITVQNAKSFMDAGACCLGVGGSLVSAGEINEGKFGAITEAARLFMRAVNS